MDEITYAIVLFHSTQRAIQAERVSLRAGLSVKLIPTPRQFSSSCGTALRCLWSDADTVCAALQAAAIEYESVHKMTVQKG